MPTLAIFEYFEIFPTVSATTPRSECGPIEYENLYRPVHPRVRTTQANSTKPGYIPSLVAVDERLLQLLTLGGIAWIESASSVVVMSKVIQIRDVPDDVHKALANAASAQGLSLTLYMLRELEHLAKRPQAVHVNASMIRQTQVKVRAKSIETRSSPCCAIDETIESHLIVS